MNLHELTHDVVKKLCANGDELASQCRYREAISEYSRAWKLLPEPKESWEAATWILVATGDASYLAHKLDDARSAFVHAIACAGGLGNPFVHLRLGKFHLTKGSSTWQLMTWCALTWEEAVRSFDPSPTSTSCI